MKKHLEIISSLLLLLTAFIWGIAFVAQSVGMKYVGPWTFVFSRFLIAAILLIPVSMFSRRLYQPPVMGEESSADPEQKGKETAGNQETGQIQRRPGTEKEPGTQSNRVIQKIQRTQETKEKRKKSEKWKLLTGGLLCGILLGVASIAQQTGIKYTTVGKAGFITALYVILVPILGMFLGKRPQKKIWFCAILGMVGLYLISMNESLHIETGDALVILCAFLFSLQIMSVDYYSARVNPVELSNIQFFGAAVVGLIGMLVFETPDLSALAAAAVPILYAGIFSSAVGYTLQVVAQKYTDPTVASLLMSLESVFSALSGWMLLGQRLSPKELLGCVLVFIAVIIAQVPVERVFGNRRAEAKN